MLGFCISLLSSYLNSFSIVNAWNKGPKTQKDSIACLSHTNPFTFRKWTPIYRLYYALCWPPHECLSKCGWCLIRDGCCRDFCIRIQWHKVSYNLQFCQSKFSLRGFVETVLSLSLPPLLSLSLPSPSLNIDLQKHHAVFSIESRN